MPCKLQKFCPISSDECANMRKASDCNAYKAVMQAYKCILSDEPSSVALEAAQRVYRYHYPQDNKMIADLTVERWVSQTQMQ